MPTQRTHHESDQQGQTHPTPCITQVAELNSKVGFLFENIWESMYISLDFKVCFLVCPKHRRSHNSRGIRETLTPAQAQCHRSQRSLSSWLF